MKIDNHFAAIIARLHNNDSTLTSLDLSNQELQETDIELLSKALEKNSYLHTLNLSNSKINPESAAILANALKQNHTLKSLDLSNNFISIDGAKAFATLLKNNQVLTELSFAGNNLFSTGVIPILNSLKTNTSLTSLDLSNTKIVTFKKQYGPWLLPHKHLQREKLYIELKDKLLQYTYINAAHEINFDKITQKELNREINTSLSLETLKTYLPDILKITTNRGHTPNVECIETIIESIIDLIKSNKTLTSLKLENSHIDSNSLIYIAKALEQNNTLTEMSIDYPQIKSALKRNAEAYANQYFDMMVVVTQANRQIGQEKNALGNMPLELIINGINPVSSPAGFRWTNAPISFFNQNYAKKALRSSETQIENAPANVATPSR